MSSCFHTWSTSCLTAILLVCCLCPALEASERRRVLVIHPGIWHIWFDAEPSPEIVERFAAIAPPGANTRVIRALTMVPAKAQAGEYEEKPVWLLGFHWDQMIDTAVEHGIPVYVTTEKGIDMYSASKPLRESRRGPELTADQITWLREHSYSGGTYGARENHRRIVEVYDGVLQKFPNARIDTFTHSQSGKNLVAVLKELFHSSRDRFEGLAPHLSTIVLWDPAITPCVEGPASTPVLGSILQAAYELRVGHEATQAEHELKGTDSPTWIGQDGKRLRYGDFVREDDPAFYAALRQAGGKWHIGVAKGTVETGAARNLAERVGGHFHDPKDMARLAGQSRLSTANVQNHLREPFAEPVRNHNFPLINPIAMQQWFGVAPEVNPAYSDAQFRNSVVADMGSAVRSGGVVDGATALPDRVENIPVWADARGNAEFIAQRTLQAMRGSERLTVVLDAGTNEPLARQVGSIIESRGGKVFYAQGLDDIVDQTLAGKQFHSVVVRLAPGENAAPAAQPERPSQPPQPPVASSHPVDTAEGVPVRLAGHTDAVISFPVDPQDVIPTIEKQQAKQEQRQVAAEQGSPVGVSVHLGTVPLARDPITQDGWSITRVGPSRWFQVQHESWEGPELVYDGSDDSPERIVSEVRKQLREQSAADGKSEGERKSAKRKVVVGGDPDDSRVRDVIRQLQATDDDGDGESDIEVVFVNCKHMSPRQAMRKVACATREQGAALGVAIIFLPGKGSSGDGQSGEDGQRLRMPLPRPNYALNANDQRDDNRRPLPHQAADQRKRYRPPLPKPPDGRAGVTLTNDTTLEAIDGRWADPRRVLQGTKQKSP